MSVRIVEVGPRDGLQNESIPIPLETKVEFIQGLIGAGLRDIEVTSFVSPKWVPQLGDAADLWACLDDPDDHEGLRYSALVPNLKGLDRALDMGVDSIAVFTAASDMFTQKNVNMTISETLEVFAEVVRQFRGATFGGRVRGYISTVFECPYSGRIEPGRVVEVAQALFEMGVDEISLGDTIGVASPREVKRLALEVLDFGADKVAWHFHDTRGTAVANVAAALEAGFSVFDSSAGGLGGCPYAPGAGGNLATEDVVYFLEREGMATGVDLTALAKASLPVLHVLGRGPQSKAQRAALASGA